MPRRPPTPRPSSDRRTQVANRLNSSAIHLLRRISKDDGADGVTGARASALSVVVYGGPLSVGDLARRERVALPTISRIVDALARDGLLARERVESDRRTVTLAATRRGRTLMERGRARRIRRLAEELRGLEDEDVEALERALDVLDRLEDRTQGGSR